MRETAKEQSRGAEKKWREMRVRGREREGRERERVRERERERERGGKELHGLLCLYPTWCVSIVFGSLAHVTTEKNLRVVVSNQQIDLSKNRATLKLT